MMKCTNAGLRTRGRNEGCIVCVIQHGGDANQEYRHETRASMRFFM